MKKIIILIALVSIFTSCITEKQRAKICASCPKETVRDSIYLEKIVYRDTTIYVKIKGENVVVFDTIYLNGEQIKVKKVFAENQFSKAFSWIDNDRLYLQLTQKDTTFIFNLKNALIEKDKIIKVLQSETKIVEVNKLTTIQKVHIFLGKILKYLLIIALLFAIFIVLTKFNILKI